MKGFNNLQFVVVYNSGHFVPINQARNSLNMISRLLEKQPLGDQELPSFGYIVQDSKKPQKVETPAEEDGQSTRGTHGMSLLTGLCGFLLGIFVSQALGKRSSCVMLLLRKKMNERYVGIYKSQDIQHSDDQHLFKSLELMVNGTTTCHNVLATRENTKPRGLKKITLIICIHTCSYFFARYEPIVSRCHLIHLPMIALGSYHLMVQLS